MTTVPFKKSIVEKYDFKSPGEYGWASITISEDGTFSARSDFGNYSYHWNSPGDNFKAFLVRICNSIEKYPEDYFYDIIADKNWRVDTKKSVKPFKNQILERRYSLDIKREEARDAWDALCRLERDDRCSIDSFRGFLFDNYFLNEIFDSEEFVYADIEFHPDYKALKFCTIVMPPFIEVLKKELEEEKKIS